VFLNLVLLHQEFEALSHESFTVDKREQRIVALAKHSEKLLLEKLNIYMLVFIGVLRILRRAFRATSASCVVVSGAGRQT